MNKNERIERALADLSATTQLLLGVEAKLAMSVTRARIAGASWQQVADGLLMTKATAHRHYRHVVEELHPDYTFPLNPPTTGP